MTCLILLIGGNIMEETKKAPQYNLIGAILFAAAALIGIITYCARIKYGFSVLNTIVTAISVGGSAVLAISLFQSRGDKLTLLGFALLALSSLVTFFAGFRYGMGSFLPNLLGAAGYLGALAVAAAHFTHYLDQYKAKIKKLWFVPAACIAAKIIVGFFVWITMLIIGGMIYHVGFWSTLISAAAIFFSSMWIVYPEGMPNKQFNPGSGAAYTPTSAVNEEEGYFELVVHVLLLLFTCGIWYYIWIYRMTKYLNIVEGEEPRNPVTKLLLCLFVPFYSIYWIYKSAQRIDKLAQSKGIQSDLSTLCLILAIFVAIIPPILMQDKVNAVIKSKTASVVSTPQQPEEPQTSATQVNAGIPEELKKYKELLDEGVITQEEFDAKKKQLLDM